jgi:hypothetical protein
VQVARWSWYESQHMSSSSIEVGWTDVAGILETVDDFIGQGRGQLGLSMGRGFPG